MCAPGRQWRWRILGTVAASFMALGSYSAQAQEAVDVELVLAVDVSLSMSPGELEIQRQGYAAALTHPTVVEAIQNGMHGRIAVTFFEWAGDFSQRVLVPWTMIATGSDAEMVAGMLTTSPSQSARRTSISGAIHFAGDLFAESPYKGIRRVVDISGDGPNNQGPSVTEARDQLVAGGATINGLPLMTNEGFTSSYDVTDLDEYYANCVIGGPGAFMIPVNEWEQFPEAIRRKLVIELAGEGWDDFRAPILLAQASPDYDCLVGERMWRNRSWIWQERQSP